VLAIQGSVAALNPNEGRLLMCNFSAATPHESPPQSLDTEDLLAHELGKVFSGQFVLHFLLE
jgi:hypothetical protein